jgi:hypothetical protein
MLQSKRARCPQAFESSVNGEEICRAIREKVKEPFLFSAEKNGLTASIKRKEY